MYLGIDIGGTKTLVAALTADGALAEHAKFQTPQSYAEFKIQLAKTVAELSTKKFIACGVGVPGLLDRKTGTVLSMGNLAWHNIPIQKDIVAIAHCPSAIENDANLAGLSEAMLLKHKYNQVLYVTISTGIGTGIIVDQAIVPAFANSEGGHMWLEHAGKMQLWESFASGHAIMERYGKLAKDITDDSAWKEIAHNIAVGLIDLIAVLQPDAIVLGGGVSSHLDKFKHHLDHTLADFETPLVPIPPILSAARPEEAVIFGCYDYAKQVYGSGHARP